MGNTGKTLWAQQYILKVLSCWNYWEWMLSVIPHFCTLEAYQNIPSPAHQGGSALPVSLVPGLWDAMVIGLKYKSLGFFAPYEPGLNQIHISFDPRENAAVGIP